MSNVTVEEILEKLDSLVGFDSVKKKIKKIADFIRVNEKRKQAGLSMVDGFSYNLVFAGKPGTGNTEVARLVGELYHALGILPTSEVIEVFREDLVAVYIGQTAIKTREVIDGAIGKVLLINDAYTLDQGGLWDFGKEALEAILTGMENHGSELVVILSGETEKMRDFLASNPGLCFRFNLTPEDLDS